MGILKITQKYGVFTDFELPISQRVFDEWKGSRYEKHFKFFELFNKFWNKGLGAPTTHPNLQMKNLKIFKIFKFFICRFGCVVGAPSPLFQNLLKSSKNLKCVSYLDPFHSTKTCWDIGSSKSVKTPYFCVIFKIPICRFGCVVGAPSPFFQKFWKSSQNLKYDYQLDSNILIILIFFTRIWLPIWF